MGKNKIEIEKIENKDKRNITFSKRRKGLFKKAAGLCSLCDAQIAIIVFSPADKLHSFGHTSVDAVIHRFLTPEVKDNKIKYNNRDFHQQMRNGGGGFWWENVNMVELDSIEKLRVVYNALLNLKQNVSKRLKKLTSSSYTATAGTSTSTSSTTMAEEDRSLFLREGDDFCWPSNEELANLDELVKFRNDLFMEFCNDDDDHDRLQVPPLHINDQEDDVLLGYEFKKGRLG